MGHLKYRSEIDGLRALAVIPVVFFHAGFARFSGGFVGVDVFFVISGYLISSLIIGEMAENRFSILRFYERRARRILPALFIVMLASAPFAWFWLMPIDLQGYLKSLLATVLFASNFLFWDQTGYFDTTADLKPLLHTWSLAVEEQYYIVFPPLLMLLWRWGRRSILWVLGILLVASLLAAQSGVRDAPAAAFFLLPARGWELLSGAFAAFYLDARPMDRHVPGRGFLAVLGVGLITVPVFAYDAQTPFPGLAALPSVIGTVLIILFASGETLAGRVLSTKALVWVGLISYSLYLWHQPIFALYRQRFGEQAFASNVFWLMAMAFALAVCSLWLVERPFRFRASLRQLGMGMAASAAVIIGSGVWMDRQMRADKANVPSYAWALKHADAELIAYVERRDTSMKCDAKAEGFGFEFCDFGDPNAPKEMVLWGDSLAGALLYGLDAVAKQQGLAGTAFISNGCPPVLGLRNTIVDDCTDKTHAEILKRILAMKHPKDVLLTGYMSAAMEAGNVLINGQATSVAEVRDQVEKAVSEIRAMGGKVYLIQQGPVYATPVSEYVLQNLRRNSAEPLVISRDEYLSKVRLAMPLADKVDGYVDTSDFYCDRAICPSVDEDGQLIIYDRNHVTKAYSLRLAAFVLGHLQADYGAADGGTGAPLR
jgi:peptidoglycan/LPS O-acetylase OafA/YrhL